MSDIAMPSAKSHDDALAGRILRLASASVGRLAPRRTHAFWRNMMARFPDEPAYAVRYVSELLLTESWTALDDAAGWAGRYHAPELDLRLVDAALARADVEQGENRIRQYLGRHGSSAALSMRLYSLHLLQRDYGGAEAVAVELASLVPAEKRQAAYLAQRARFLGQLSSDWSRNGHGQRDFDIHVINLDSDTVRLERVEKQLHGADYARIAGVKGAQLPELALKTLTGNQGSMQKGTVGCFLSHLVAWERVAAGGRPALVLEDDAWLLAGVPPSVAALNLPEGFDLVFANERMSPDSLRYPKGEIGTIPVGASVRTKKPGWSSVGTDGYFVSPKGAKKLLAMLARDGIAGDVDWRLLSYALTESQRARLRAGGFAANAIAFHEGQHTRQHRIRASVLSPAIIRQFAGGSVRLWDNALPHSHMAAARSLVALQADT